MLSNAVVEAEKNIRTIKEEVEPEGGIRNPRTFMEILEGGGGGSIKIVGSGGKFNLKNITQW